MVNFFGVSINLLHLAKLLYYTILPRPLLCFIPGAHYLFRGFHQILIPFRVLNAIGQTFVILLIPCLRSFSKVFSYRLRGKTSV